MVSCLPFGKATLLVALKGRGWEWGVEKVILSKEGAWMMDRPNSRCPFQGDFPSGLLRGMAGAKGRLSNSVHS